MAKSAKRTSFVLYYDWVGFAKKADAAAAGDGLKLIEAVAQLTDNLTNGTPYEEPEFGGLVAETYFDAIKPIVASNAEKFLETCARRAESGSKGGKAKAENMRKGNCYQKLPNATKRTPTDIHSISEATKSYQNVAKLANVADNDNDNETDIDNENDALRCPVCGDLLTRLPGGALGRCFTCGENYPIGEPSPDGSGD